MFLPKDESIRKSDCWEVAHLPEHYCNYAALDVVASRLVFEKASQLAPIECVQYDTPPGTHVALLVQEGGDIAAYGTIAALQPSSLSNVRVRVPTKSRLVIDISTVLIPSAAAILHLVSSQQGKTKSGALTIGQLQLASSSVPFQVVSPISLLVLDHQQNVCHN